MLPRMLAFLATGFAVAASPLSAESPLTGGKQFEPYFRPVQTDRAALSHDGRYVAYTVHKGTILNLQIVDLDNPAGRTSVAVAEDFFIAEYSNRKMTDDTEKQIARLDHLRWVTPRRLVFCSNEGRVYAINADGTDVKTLATPEEVGDDGKKSFKRRRPTIINALDYPAPKLLLEGRDGGDADLFEVNFVTGGLDEIDALESRFRNGYLYDQQGRIRMRFHGKPRPQRYEYVNVKGKGKDLDAVVDKAAGLSFKITPENFLESRSIPIGFGYDPEVLYYTSNVGRDTYGIYALDLRTGKPTDFKIEHPLYDIGDPDNTYLPSILVLDRHKKSLVGVRFTGIKRATIWLDEDLRKLQAKFDREMPHKTIAIHDWDETRSRFIVNISSSADPGTWFVVDRKSGKMIEFAKRAPWLTPDVRHPGGPFEFTTPQGVRINGYLTLPREKRAGRTPLVVYCRETAWGRQMPEFSSHVQAVAAMGFAVLQVNHRGCEGFGTKHRVSASDAIDRVAAEDILAAVDWVCTREKIHPALTAVFGFGWGGYFALRTMELYPKRFRCGVVVDPQTDVGMMFNYENEFSMRTEVYKQLFGKDRKKLQEMSASHNAGTLTQPLLVIRNEDAGAGTRAQTEAILAAVRATGNTPEIVNVTREFMRKPVTTAKTFDQIQGFFNLNIYKFDAEAGEAKVVEDPKPQAPEDKIVPDGAEP